MRLIDADELMESVRYHADRAKQMCLPNVYNGISIACGEINHAPTIDAEPVRHGHWIIHVDELFPSESSQECSVCHAEEGISLKHENYCPNCGARMDEVSE